LSLSQTRLLFNHCLTNKAPSMTRLSSLALLMLSLSMTNGLAAADLKYHREDYPHWSDLDGNGLNTRHDLLATQSTVKPSFSRDGKTVTRGRWVSPWTGQIYLDPFALDVDHTVPLGYAHARGGKYWDRYQREMFANDVRMRGSPSGYRPPISVSISCDFTGS